MRPEHDSAPHLLPRSGGAFLNRLLKGASLIDARSDAQPDLDLQATLTLLLNGEAITGLQS